MALGQAAGITASLAIDRKVAVQDVDMSILQDLLIDQKATLIYFRASGKYWFPFGSIYGIERVFARMGCGFARNGR